MDSKELQAMIKDLVGSEFAELRKELSAVTKDNAAEIRKAATPSATSKKVYGSDPLKTKDEGELNEKERNIMAGRWVRYMARGKGDAGRAMEIAKKDGEETLCKALGQSTLAGGGALLPTQFSGDTTEFLRAKSTVLAAGVPTVPMNGGSLVIPYIGTGSTASYVAENANAPKTEPVFGQLSLHDHKLTAVLPVSNDLLNNGGSQVDAMLSRDLASAVAAKMDVTFLRSPGVSGEPKGMYFWAPSGNLIASNATYTVDTVTSELMTAQQKLLDGNVDPTSGFYVMAPRTWAYLFGLLTSNKEPAFRTEMQMNKTLMGYKFFVTSQIPITLGSGDKTEVYFAAADSLLVAENGGIEINAYEGGTYHDGSNLVSGISQDQTALRIKTKHDFGARYRGAEIAVIDAVKWGV